MNKQELEELGKRMDAMEEKMDYFDTFLATKNGIKDFSYIVSTKEARIEELTSLFKIISVFKDNKEFDEITSQLLTFNYPRFAGMKDESKRKLLKTDEYGVDLYFYPYKDGKAYIGYVKKFSDDLFYFTGFDVDEKYAVELSIIISMLRRKIKQEKK